MIKTFKRNIGDKVWMMFDNKPHVFTIVGMSYCEFIGHVCFELNTSEKYTVIMDDENGDKYKMIVKDEDIFNSKEELIKSL